MKTAAAFACCMFLSSIALAKDAEPPKSKVKITITNPKVTIVDDLKDVPRAVGTIVDKPKGTIVDKPKDVPEAVGTFKGVWRAFKGSKWREAIAGVIVLLIFLWRRFASKLIIGKLSTWQVGFVTVLLGYLGTVPEALAAEPFKWSAFAIGGLLTSAEAMMFWLLIGKKLLPKIFGDVKKDVTEKPQS